MRNPKKKANVAIIGGTGFEDLLKEARQIRIGTPYGLPSPIYIGKIDGEPLAFLPRHGTHHSIPPHKVGYQANVYALDQLGVERIIATNAVGAIDMKLSPGDLVVPHDLVDFTKFRRSTFYDGAPVTHVDMSQPYCPEIRRSLIRAAKPRDVEVRDRAVFVCTEGPRYETPAEIGILGRLGCDIVGMTGAPEAVLARELEICYATLCFVTNRAAGMQERLTASEVAEMAKERLSVIRQILRAAIKDLPENRGCPCAHALEDARLRRSIDA